MRIFVFLVLFCSISFAQELPDSLKVDSTTISKDAELEALKDSLMIKDAIIEYEQKRAKIALPTPKKKEPEKPEKTEETIENVGNNVEETVSNIRNIISPSKIITIVVVLLFTYLLVKVIYWFFDVLIKRFQRRRLQILRIKPIVAVIIWVFTIIALVKAIFDPSAEALWAAAGASGIGLAFALQDIGKNIFGGLMILINRPFQVGDRVQIKDNYGEVVKIGLQTTTINTLDDSLVTVPNSVIINDNVSNANSGALDCMVVVDLWLPVIVDVERVRKIAFESAITSRYLNIDKAVTVLFFDHFDNQPATNVKIKAYVLDARYEKPFEGDVTESAKKAFREAGVYSEGQFIRNE